MMPRTITVATASAAVRTTLASAARGARQGAGGGRPETRTWCVAAFALLSPFAAHHNHVRDAAARVELPAAHVRVVPRDCPDSEQGSGVSCVYVDRPNVIYTTRTADITLMHELGHVYDYSHTMRPWQRLHFRRIMGWPRNLRPWYDWDTPAPLVGADEKFADAYAACALGLVPSVYWRPSGYRYMPNDQQHAEVCALIRPRTTCVSTTVTVPRADDPPGPVRNGPYDPYRPG